MIVRLLPWEYVHAHDVGIRRFVANWGVPDKPSYQQGNNMPEIIASPAAAITELAVAKALGRYWGGHVWDNRDHSRHRDISDVEPNIEVRRIRERTNPVSIWQRDYGKGKTLVVAYAIPPEYLEVEILGWLPLDIAWQKGRSVGNNRRTFTTDKLRPIERLINGNISQD
jgi:hypothetical protein